MVWNHEILLWNLDLQMINWRKTMDYELKELLSQINTALDLESECIKTGVELWEIREGSDVELARDSFIVDNPLFSVDNPLKFSDRLNKRVKFCETVEDFVSTMADMSLSRKVMEVALFRGYDDPKQSFLMLLLGPDDKGKTNIDCNLIELLSNAYDSPSPMRLKGQI